MANDATWVFDVDGTLVDSLTGRSLRPGAAELLTRLRAGGAAVLVWSAGGAEYARRRATDAGIDELIDQYAAKSTRDANGRYETAELALGDGSAWFVDDMPADLPLDAHVIKVRPYLAPNPHDRGLDVVARLAAGPPT